jgi:tRNA threonylcarbamoyladenosine biosynthesis protein TsaB
MTDLLLAIDTATRTGVLGLAEPNGGLLASETWTTGHRHGEELLSRLDTLLDRVGAQPRDIQAIAVGIGPGSFTGLRIGLATAKTLAYALGAALIGVSTTHALALAAAAGQSGDFTVTLPAGASDRYVSKVRVAQGAATDIEPARLTTAAGEPPSNNETLAAVDLEVADIPAEAVEVGRRAVGALAAAIAQLGATALAAGKSADVAELVPAYVALPRGITEIAGTVEWSPDLR